MWQPAAWDGRSHHPGDQHDIPFDSEAYVHRSRRTGRAGRAVTAILYHPKGKAFPPGLERLRWAKPIDLMEVSTKCRTFNQNRLVQACFRQSYISYAEQELASISLAQRGFCNGWVADRKPTQMKLASLPDNLAS